MYFKKCPILMIALNPIVIALYKFIYKITAEKYFALTELSYTNLK